MAKHSQAAQKMRKIKIDRFSALDVRKGPEYQNESIEEFLARGGKIQKLKSKACK